MSDQYEFHCFSMGDAWGVRVMLLVKLGAASQINYTQVSYSLRCAIYINSIEMSIISFRKLSLEPITRNIALQKLRRSPEIRRCDQRINEEAGLQSLVIFLYNPSGMSAS